MAQAQYMEDVSGFVLDEDRIVTYKWLSNSLSVSANAAKRSRRAVSTQANVTLISRILHKFVEENRDRVTATYFLHAEQEVDGKTERHFTVLREEQLEEAQKKFSRILSSHVFRSEAACFGLSVLTTPQRQQEK
eukprot:748060-Hanusia_phi.AAC.2